MKERIIVAAIFVPLLFIIIFFLPPYVFAAVIAVVCAVCAFEFALSVGNKKHKRIAVYTVVSAALIPAGVYFNGNEFVFLLVFLILLCLVSIEAAIVFKTEREISFAQILAYLFGGALIPLLISTLISLRNMPDGRYFVLLPVISAFITDAGAYFTGKLLGKHKAVPLISPKKTVEGYIGGIVIGTAAMVLYGVILYFSTPYEIRFAVLILYGLIGAVVTELGDLVFSMIKREYDFKDYGRLLPGHGGMLDRFDSMVFAAPAMYLLIQILPAITSN